MPTSFRNPNRFRLLLRTIYERRNACTWIPLAPTGSMDPLFGGQTTVCVRWGNVRPSPGDITLFMTADGILTVHRVVALRQRAGIEVLQMADQFNYRDPYSGGWIPLSDLLGTVIAFQRPGLGLAPIALDTSAARRLNRYLAVTQRILWVMGGANAGWFHSVEPLRRLGFHAAKAIHIGLSFVVAYLLRLLSHKVMTACGDHEEGKM